MPKFDQWPDRIGAGPCEWRYEKDCWAESELMRKTPAQIGVIARMEHLIERVQAGTISEINSDPKDPVYKPSLDGMRLVCVGELRGSRTRQRKKIHVRLYYTQPDSVADLVLGAKLAEKPDSADDDAWREIQNSHMAEAAIRHFSWVALPSDQQVCASAVASAVEVRTEIFK